MLWMGADRSVTAVFSRPKCVVPRVTGRTLAAAKAAIRKRHCRVGKIARAYSRLKKGLVISQRPPAGRSLRAGAPVALTSHCEECQFKQIPFPARWAQLRGRLRAIPGGIHVFAAGQDETVYPLEGASSDRGSDQG